MNVMLIIAGIIAIGVGSVRMIANHWQTDHLTQMADPDPSGETIETASKTPPEVKWKPEAQESGAEVRQWFNYEGGSETILSAKKSAAFIWSETQMGNRQSASVMSDGTITINATPEELEALIEEMKEKGDATTLCTAYLFLEIAKLRRQLED